jgi:thiamine biosynthesis lipoprotein
MCGLVIGLALCSSGSSSEQPELKRFEFTQTHMGSEFKVVLYCAEEQAASVASQSAFARIAELDQELSDYDPESELMRLCDRAGMGPVKVGEDLFRVLEASQVMSARSDGAFDASVGPLVHLWRRARRTRKLPDAHKLAEARERVGYQNIHMDSRARTVDLARPGMKLDLGGIAKGFAAQEALKTLQTRGIRRALVAGAGDIAVGDPPPGREGWTIAVAPLGSKAEGQEGRFILLKNAAVSSSGDAERYVEIDGKRYAHIVDPRTGLGIVNRAGVTVVAADGTTADALDTAVYVLGPERGLPLVENVEGAAALFVKQESDGVKTYPSKRWQAIRETRAKSEP